VSHLMTKPINSLSPFSFRYIATAGMVSLLLFSQGVVGIASASAKVVNRAQGRCKLSTNDAVAYDGHCVIKHKENNQGDEVVVVKLDNDAKYSFSGPNLDALQVEAWDGIHNVSHRYRENREEFVWDVDGRNNRLSVKTDAVHAANVSHDDDDSGSAVVGTLVGAGLGLLIGSILASGGSDDSSNEQAPSNPYAEMDYYDATSSFRCSVGDANKDQLCPAGIKRHGGDRASITVLFPNHHEATYEFNGDDVTSSYSGDLTWGKQGDTWSIGIDGQLFIDIPEAAVQGG